MPVWDELKGVLLDLEGSGVLLRYPDPRGDEDRQPPIEIHLESFATATAEELHRRFGDDLELVVGSLTFPERQPWRPRPAGHADSAPAMDPSVFTVELAGPVTVTSGHSTEGALRVHNNSSDPVGIVTNGQVTARVVDPVSGLTVGGFAGAQRLPRVVFGIAPGDTESIPMLVGTAGSSPNIGYTVPAGKYAVQVVLELEDGRVMLTPPLPVTVTG